MGIRAAMAHIDNRINIIQTTIYTYDTLGPYANEGNPTEIRQWKMQLRELEMVKDRLDDDD